MIKQTKAFFSETLWQYRIDELGKWKGFLVKQLRIVTISAKEFTSDQCLLRASALTYFTLLSIVPVVAMVFGVAQGFGLEEALSKWLIENLKGQDEVLKKVLDFSHKMLEKTKGGLVAGIGVAVLFWSAMNVLSNIEESFNAIWRVNKPRSILRKFTDYLAILFLGPLLVVTAGSATIFISTQLAKVSDHLVFAGYFSSALSFLFKLIPYVIIWLLLTLIYVIIPNTRVRFSSALAAGIIAGTAFQLVQWGYIEFQVGVARYNAIYGSFAALPLFLGWLQISWIIVLGGAEIAFAHQTFDPYGMGTEAKDVRGHEYNLLCLLVTYSVVKNYMQGKALTISALATALKLPQPVLLFVTSELNRASILSEVRIRSSDELAFQPAVDPDRLTIRYVLDAIDNAAQTGIMLKSHPGANEISNCLEDFRKLAEQSPSNRLLKEM